MVKTSILVTSTNYFWNQTPIRVGSRSHFQPIFSSYPCTGLDIVNTSARLKTGISTVHGLRILQVVSRLYFQTVTSKWHKTVDY